MKISLKEITREINENEFVPKNWKYEEIAYVETLDTTWGKMDKYIVTVRFKAGKYDDNGIAFQINHYVDTNTYQCYYNGSCYLG